MLELNAKILNTFVSPAKSGTNKKDGKEWKVEQAYKLQLIWEVPLAGGDVKMVTQDLSLSMDAYKLCVGKTGSEIRIPIETYVIEGKLGMKAVEGAVPRFIKSAPAAQ